MIRHYSSMIMLFPNHKTLPTVNIMHHSCLTKAQVLWLTGEKHKAMEIMERTYSGKA